MFLYKLVSEAPTPPADKVPDRADVTIAYIKGIELIL